MQLLADYSGGKAKSAAFTNAFAAMLSEFSRKHINREETFIDRKRIDIIIKVYKGKESYLLVGIENKIDSRETDDQTTEYYKLLKKIKDEEGFEILLPIYLRPDTNPNSAKSTKFNNLFYSNLKEILESTPFDLRRDIRKSFFLFEFILYVEEVLMNNNGKVKLTPVAELYMDNRRDLEKAREEFSNYANWFDEKFAMDILEKVFGNKKEYYSFRGIGEGGNPVALLFYKPKWCKKYPTYPDFCYRIDYKNVSKRLCELENDEVTISISFEITNLRKKCDCDDLTSSQPKRISLNLKKEMEYDNSIAQVAEHFKSVTKELDDIFEKSEKL